MQDNMEISTNPPDTTPDEPTVADIPGLVGRLTPDEQKRLMQIREESQKLLLKLGEYDVLKARVMSAVERLEAEGQEAINSISRRVGIPDGQQWVALADGTIRVVNPSPQGATNGSSVPS